MYILKHAVRSICRSKGRSILIGVILFVLALCSCIGLGIQKAADSSRAAMEALTNITATIETDRRGMMEQAQPPEGGQPQEGDREAMREQLQEQQSLTLEELQTYAQADSVSAFYYTGTLYMAGTDELEAVTSSQSESRPGPSGGLSTDSFALIGYSSDEAMSDFIDGTASISEGSMFAEGGSDPACVISSELALYNDISVGDEITLQDQDGTAELTLTVSGIYERESAMMQGPGVDSANQILMSYAALAQLAEDVQLSPQVIGTYVFSTMTDYEAFDAECRELGLDEAYTISSTDVNAYEQSLIPLENLSNFAFWFLAVILLIGVVVLIVINVFSIRERKYEIGVLCAIGMRKGKIAMQFLCENMVIALIALLLGFGAGAVLSVPASNALLQTQIASSSQRAQRMDDNFGRGGMPGDQEGQDMQQMEEPQEEAPEMPSDGMVSAVSSVSEASDPIILLQMAGIAFVLVILSSSATLISIFRFDPLTILANRD